MISKQIKLRLLLSEIKIHITEPCSLQAVLAANNEEVQIGKPTAVENGFAIFNEQAQLKLMAEYDDNKDEFQPLKTNVFKVEENFQQSIGCFLIDLNALSDTSTEKIVQLVNSAQIAAEVKYSATVEQQKEESLEINLFSKQLDDQATGSRSLPYLSKLKLSRLVSLSSNRKALNGQHSERIFNESQLKQQIRTLKSQMRFEQLNKKKLQQQQLRNKELILQLNNLLAKQKQDKKQLHVEIKLKKNHQAELEIQFKNLAEQYIVQQKELQQSLKQRSQLELAREELQNELKNIKLRENEVLISLKTMSKQAELRESAIDKHLKQLRDKCELLEQEKQRFLFEKNELLNKFEQTERMLINTSKVKEQKFIGDKYQALRQLQKVKRQKQQQIVAREEVISQIEIITQRKQSFEKQISQLKALNQSLSTQVSEFQYKLQEQRSNLKNEQYQIRFKLQNLETQNKTLQEEFALQKHQLKQKTQKEVELLARCQHFQREMDSLLSQVKQNAKVIKSVELERDQVLKEKEKAEEKLKKHQIQISQLTLLKESFSEKISELTEQCRSKKSQILSLSKQNNTADLRIQSLEAESQKLKGIQKIKDQQIIQCKSQIEAIEAVSLAYKSDNISEIERLNQLSKTKDQQISLAAIQIESLKNNIIELSNTISNLQSQLFQQTNALQIERQYNLNGLKVFIDSIGNEQAVLPKKFQHKDPEASRLMMFCIKKHIKKLNNLKSKLEVNQKEIQTLRKNILDLEISIKTKEQSHRTQIMLLDQQRKSRQAEFEQRFTVRGNEIEMINTLLVSCQGRQKELLEKLRQSQQREAQLRQKINLLIKQKNQVKSINMTVLRRNEYGATKEIQLEDSYNTLKKNYGLAVEKNGDLQNKINKLVTENTSLSDKLKKSESEKSLMTIELQMLADKCKMKGDQIVQLGRLLKQAWIDSDASGSKNSQMMLQNQHELLSHSEGINVLTIHGRVFDKNEEEDPIRRALTQSLSACQLSKYPNEGQDDFVLLSPRNIQKNNHMSQLVTELRKLLRFRMKITSKFLQLSEQSSSMTSQSQHSHFLQTIMQINTCYQQFKRDILSRFRKDAKQLLEMFKDLQTAINAAIN